MSNEIETVGTSIETPVPAAPTTEDAAASSVGVTVETKAYRTYGVLDEKGNPSAVKKDKDGVTKTIDEPIIAQQTADGKSWARFEEDGNTKLSENNFKFYTVETIDGFLELITDDTLRIYYINRGLTAVQTAKANQYQKEFDESTKEFVYSDETIDMRDLLNEAPKRAKLSDVQKVARDVSALAPEERDKLIALLLAQLGQS
jgi:hypothetical protein